MPSDPDIEAKEVGYHFTSINLTEKLKPIEPEAVIRELEYLAEEGYIETRSPVGDAAIGTPYYYCKITSKGINEVESW